MWLLVAISIFVNGQTGVTSAYLVPFNNQQFCQQAAILVDRLRSLVPDSPVAKIFCVNDDPLGVNRQIIFEEIERILNGVLSFDREIEEIFKDSGS